jgi:hypothetical protein
VVLGYKAVTGANVSNKRPKLDPHHLASDELHKLYLNELLRLAAQVHDELLCMDKTFFLFSIALEDPEVKQNADVRDVLHLLLSRVMRTYRSMRALIAEGMGQDGLGLLRNLIESTLTLEFIASDASGLLAQRFRDFAAIEREKHLCMQQKEIPKWLPPGGDAEVRRIRRQARAFEEKYNTRDKKERRHWHGLGGMADLARALGRMPDYLWAYSTFSYFTHPSYLTRQQYSHNPSETGNATWAPSAIHTQQVAWIGTSYLLRAVQAYTRHLGIESAVLTDTIAEVHANLLAAHRAGKDIPKPSGLSGLTVRRGTWVVLPEELRATKRQR